MPALFRRLLPLAALASLAACAAKPVSVFDQPRRETTRIVPLAPPALPPPPRVTTPETRTALADASRRVEAARRAVPGYRDPDALLEGARRAAGESNNPRAQSLARQAGARADAVVEAQRTREAATLLKALYDTTGLSDAQLAAMRAAEAALVRGENGVALQRLKDIKAKTSETRPYTVQRGDTLSAIAARDSVYGNSLLWPLLWAANRDTIPDPHRLRAGQTLKIRPSPSIDEVVLAIVEARRYPARVRIGRVIPR